MTDRTCSVDGCGKKHRARGYCATHYNAILAPDRHKTVIVCAECGETYTTKRTNGRYCSLTCRDAERNRDIAERKAATARDASVLVGPVARRRPGRADEVKHQPRYWVSGPCAWCATEFTAQTWERALTPRYCSSLCAKRQRHATRSNPGLKWISATERYAIYHRDQWTCQLCGTRVSQALHRNDDWAPSLDHVVPRSRGGGHEPTNLRLAHRWCNAYRSDSLDDDLFAKA